MEYSEPFLNKKIEVVIDRKMGDKHPKWGFIYPINYGYIKDTKAPDGKEIDAYILGVFDPTDAFIGNCIAIIHRTNDNDDKLIVVPEGEYYSDEQIIALTEFQERYFKSEIIR